ncbi:hypothetical protein GETHOR_10540 [Geothrix oryzae]|uniref:MetA-pathway of phenol degradation n=1 Tax=Geothrix oryzae TaxID=2927975 RepID=A0ABM8DPR4_9BACT|nr:hypothetical protein [Geothrix oryzae]BDU68953.1 hypothetical protein GETHOR_10540 [Geothrix oryzae]
MFRAWSRPLALCLLLLPGGALSAQGFADEIQVYTNDIQKPGKVGLELHLNRILQGPKEAPPGLPFNGSWNLTPEISYGLLPSLDIGLYLPTALDTDHHYRFSGPKFRLKWLPIRGAGEEATGPFLGLNLEVARTNRSFSDLRWETELRGLAGVQGQDWLLAVNPVFTWPLSDGQGRGTPDFATAWKATYTRWKTAAPGLELYLDHGLLNQVDLSREQSQRLFLTLDVDHAPLVFNVGLGRGLTAASERWTLKFIFEFAF